ncbi:MAG: methyltransferase domain-containing protein [Flavobacterium sp.]|uniref:class I SAM-dependent methyltransferase n=1 Tax=Flavobacterium sp. TaxID=239 RepID=UPI003265D8F5
MKYLNLGCGNYFSKEREWVNLDFVSSYEGVIAHNLLQGIPFEDNSFDLVYHSHVLEHFSKEDGETLISECFRVLKPNGVLRIAIPDLEIIAKKYLDFLEQGISNPNDELIRANYEWMKIEMYDQTVRNVSGGNMKKYVRQDNMINEDFVIQRIGEQGRVMRNNFLNAKNNNKQAQSSEKKNTPSIITRIINKVKKVTKNKIIKFLDINPEHIAIGSFRLGGEIHQWMYDRYSLTSLLTNYGGCDIKVRDAFSSYISNWSEYKIDGKDNVVRKPDSLFIECFKK